MKTVESKVKETTVVAPALNGNGNGRVYVDLGSLRPDPDQPRKTFDQVKLEELAESIRQQGIIADLIVVDRTGDNEAPWYQIVDGERRWKAAQLAGLKQVPVAVREVNEKQKLALQVVANQQREALTALDEAAAYRKEIESGRHTAESLYKALGISRGTMFSRLALNRLHPPVRAALEQGKISVSVAGLVSVVPGVKAQEELLEELTDECGYRFPWSFRDVQEHIEEEYCKPLKGAPFDTKKGYYGEFKDEESKDTVMLHLRGTCEDCRFRSGNIEGVAVKNPKVCTQPRCYKAKAEAEWQFRKESAEGKGVRTIDAAQWAKVKGQYVLPEQEEYIGAKFRTWNDAMGGAGKKLERVLVQTPQGLQEVLPRKDAVEAAKKNGVKIQEQPSHTPYDYKAEWARPLVVSRLRAMAEGEAWRLIAQWFWDELHHRVSKELREEYKTLKAGEARQWVLEAVYCSGDCVNYQGGLATTFATMCEKCGVDVGKRLKEVKEEAKKVATTKNTQSTEKKSKTAKKRK
jgi:ParB/RepB/Spo0J family partition protein